MRNYTTHYFQIWETFELLTILHTGHYFEETTSIRNIKNTAIQSWNWFILNNPIRMWIMDVIEVICLRTRTVEIQGHKWENCAIKRKWVRTFSNLYYIHVITDNINTHLTIFLVTSRKITQYSSIFLEIVACIIIQMTRSWLIQIPTLPMKSIVFVIIWIARNQIEKYFIYICL
mgnify:CR=1 FL=1